jgi:imidazolonepropionase-like amidohydrolase
MQYLLKNGSILDTKSGMSQKGDVAIKNGTIVGPSLLQDPEVIDLEGRIVSFGLWDCHAHPGSLMYDSKNEGYFQSVAEWTVRAGKNLLDSVAMGVTGIRTTSESIGIDSAWARSFEAGLFKGPRVKCSGPGLRVTGGHGTTFPKEHREVHVEWVADGADGMRVATRELIESGVDLIKLMITGGLYSEHETVEDSQFTEDELRAVMAVAVNKGIPVAAHCGGARAAELFANLGGRSIEHGYALDEKAAAAMAKNGTWLVPTIGVTTDIALMEADGWPEHAKTRAKLAAVRHKESLRICLAAGVRIATGADLNPIGPRLHAEMVMLEEAGMSRLEVLHAATAGGRELNGMGDASAPTHGALADLLILDKNPLEDIDSLKNPAGVLTFGRLVKDWRLA